MSCMSLSTYKLWEFVVVSLLLTFNIFHTLFNVFIAEVETVEIPASKDMKEGKSCYSVHMTISRRHKWP